MKFKDLYKAVMNKRTGDLNKKDIKIALNRAEVTLVQQREALNKCIFGRKRYMSGRTSKHSGTETMCKAGPWFELIESDRVLNKLDSVSKLYEKVNLVKKQLKLELE